MQQIMTDVEARKVVGNVYQYVFSQDNKLKNMYKMRMVYLRRLFEGKSVLDLSKCKHEDQLSLINQDDDQACPTSILELFQDLKIEMLQEIDEYNKIVRLEMGDVLRKSDESVMTSLRVSRSSLSMRKLLEQCHSHIFLLNYQVVKTGSSRDARKEACISLMNFDPATN